MNGLVTRHYVAGSLILLLPLLFAGCSQEKKVAKHLERANGYYAAGKYEEAEIEYKNVLRLSQTNGLAISRLGIIYHEQGKLVPAIVLLQKAKELAPDDLEARTKLGWSLYAGQKLKEAREEALYILSKEPTRDEALILLGETVQTTNDLAEVTQHLERLRPEAEKAAGYQIAWSNVYFRQNNLAETEAALKKAFLLDPKSTAVLATLANFYWTQDNLPEAERFFQAVADMAPPRSNRRLRCAEFKIAKGDKEAGKAILTEVTKTTPDYLPAWIRLADLAFSEKKYKDCEAFLKQVLAQDPVNFDAALLSGRVKLVQGQVDEALSTFEKLNKTFVGAPNLLYHLALAQILKKDRAGALNSLNQAVARNPFFSEAVLLQANLNIENGDPDAAILALKTLIQARPRLAQAHLLLANAYRSQGNFNDALTVYDRLIVLYPKNPEGPFLKGVVHLQQNQKAEAQKAFQDALELDAKYVPAVEKLVDINLANKQYPAALQRVQKLLDTDQDKPLPHLLLGKVYFAQGNLDQAEAAVNQAIKLLPDYQPAYVLLVQIYIAAKKHQEALAKLQPMLAKNPNNKSVLLQIGMIYDALKDYQKARDTYEKLIQIDPDYTPALNNLAYLYAEFLGNLERAYELGRKAKDRAPDDPFSADTLGWILYKRGEFSRALPLLKESAGQLHNQPEVLYHLGMTYYMLGQEGLAGEMFQGALQSPQESPHRADIQRRVSFLGIDPKTAGPDAIAVLEQARQTDPGDLLVLYRLAKIYERNGAVDKEIEVSKEILAKDRKNLPTLKRLAWLYSEQPGKTDAALDLAKQARDLDAQDPSIAHLLGRLTFRGGDSAWSLSLLQESARKLPDQPDVLSDLGWSLYSMGRLAEARSTLQNALPKTTDSSKASETRQFLTMIELALNPQKMGPVASEIQKILATNPNYVPALFVSGLLQENAGQYAQAREVYEKILALKGYGAFAPASKQLAVLLVEKLGDYDNAYNHAVKAREAYPKDGSVAKVLGILAYKRNDHARAIQLLKESTGSITPNADIFYYLGLAYFQLKQNNESEGALRQALTLDANSPLAEEAKRILAQFQK
jgi:tetratricopeptide (TPR) repeat protein